MIHAHSTLPAYTSFGSYPIAYLVKVAVRYRGLLMRTEEQVACPHCARLISGQRFGMDAHDTLEALTQFVHWEGEPLECEFQFEGCTEQIEPAYPNDPEPLDPADAPGFDPGSYYDERDARDRETDES